MDLVQVLAIWVHMLGLVIVMGYYGVLGKLVVPALGRALDVPSRVAALVELERRALPLVLLSVVLFVITGTYLMVINPNYTGLGDFFGSTWSALLLFKHLVVLGFIGLGVLVDALVRSAGRAPTDEARVLDIRLLELAAEAATGLGALAILLTAAAQLA